MKIRTLYIKTLAFIAVCVLFQLKVKAQTSGTLNFTINPVSKSGSYGTKHLVAVWIENNSGTFIKTKFKYASSKNYDHLANWTSKSGSSLVDAISGSTLTTYSALNFSWNGTNTSNVVVPDGDYKIWIEFAWDNSKTEDVGKKTTSFSFTKGSSPYYLSPANSNLFTDVTINWVPTANSVNELTNQNYQISPNPTTGFVNVVFLKPAKDCKLQVGNSLGATVFKKSIANNFTGREMVDLSEFPAGIYFINILNQNESENSKFKVILNR